MIVRAHSRVHARLKANLGGLEGVFVEGHQLDASRNVCAAAIIISSPPVATDDPGRVSRGSTSHASPLCVVADESSHTGVIFILPRMQR
jgi:hypothetical protein